MGRCARVRGCTRVGAVPRVAAGRQGRGGAPGSGRCARGGAVRHLVCQAGGTVCGEVAKRTASIACRQRKGAGS